MPKTHISTPLLHTLLKLLKVILYCHASNHSGSLHCPTLIPCMSWTSPSVGCSVWIKSSTIISCMANISNIFTNGSINTGFSPRCMAQCACSYSSLIKSNTPTSHITVLVIYPYIGLVHHKLYNYQMMPYQNPNQPLMKPYTEMRPSTLNTLVHACGVISDSIISSAAM